MSVHHEEFLLGSGKAKSFEALKHTARGLEAIGFNPHASMYHVDRDYTPESDDERALMKKNKQKKSFLKKLMGGEKEKGEKI